MGVTGERERHTALRECGPEGGVVRQGEHRHAGRYLCQRCGNVDAAVRRIGACGGITGAGHGERGATARHGARLVRQDVASHPFLEASRDVVPAGVDVVIPRDDVHAEGCVEHSYRIGIRISVLGVIVNQVTSDGDEVGLE